MNEGGLENLMQEYRDRRLRSTATTRPMP
jgi:hypothetical protein